MGGFDWDDGNSEKCRKHGMTLEEVEHVLLAPSRSPPTETIRITRSEESPSD